MWESCPSPALFLLLCAIGLYISCHSCWLSGQSGISRFPTISSPSLIQGKAWKGQNKMLQHTVLPQENLRGIHNSCKSQLTRCAKKYSYPDPRFCGILKRFVELLRWNIWVITDAKKQLNSWVLTIAQKRRLHTTADFMTCRTWNGCLKIADEWTLIGE